MKTMTYQEFKLTVLKSIDYLPSKEDMQFAYVTFYQGIGQSPELAWASMEQLKSFSDMTLLKK
jgi:hypothetical protein